MTQEPGGEASVPISDKSVNDVAREKQRVAKTMLDINLGDLIDPLTEGLTADLDNSAPKLQQKESEQIDAKPGRVAKTLLETVLPNLNGIDAFAEKSVQPNQALNKPDPKTRQPVLKTMLEMQMPDIVGETNAVTPKVPSLSAQNLQAIKARKISKTMLDVNIEGLESLQVDSKPAELDAMESKVSPEKPKAKPKPVREQYTARTMLDHNMLFNAVSESHHKRELEVAARMQEIAKEPPKPQPIPVKADRPASPCAWQWEETDAKEKYRYCAKCQTPVYNLAGMEKTEAEALIFNRENRDKFTLYSRPDGKFMTTDCPLQEKRKKELIMFIIGAIALVIGAVTFLILMPPPPASETTATAPRAVRRAPLRAAKSSASNIRAAGNGTGLQTFTLPEPKKDGPETHDPDEDGSFWKY
jgi:hypothetical protein